MKKPTSMIIKETKEKLASVINESGLSPIVLELIIQGFYSEIHILTEKQILEDEVAYRKAIESENVKKDKG